MTPARLARMRELLEAARADKLRRLEALRPGLQVEREADPLDDAQRYQERDEARLERKPLVEDLRDINEALARLRMGLAGICDGCGEEIPSKRLDAIPWASTCLRCAERTGGRAA